MAPKTVLTIEALDEQTALELPERELMNCGCGSLLGGLNVQVGIGASVGTSCNTGLAIGAGAVITTGSYGCS